MKNIEDQFNHDMFEIYRSAKRECRYNATDFLNMLYDQGGLLTAKRLLVTDKIHYGFYKLSQCNCLHLTVECLVLRPKYRPLFDASELERARKRLREFKYDPSRCERE